jgi:hypothetical protein
MLAFCSNFVTDPKKPQQTSRRANNFQNLIFDYFLIIHYLCNPFIIIRFFLILLCASKSWSTRVIRRARGMVQPNTLRFCHAFNKNRHQILSRHEKSFSVFYSIFIYFIIFYF